MPNEYVNKLILGNDTLFDLSGDTATAADVAAGKTFHLASGAPAVGTASGGGTATITGEYTASTKTLEILTDGVLATWWGGIDPELMGETRWSAAVSDAYNWPLTPTTSAQNLTWTTSYTATANANATINRIGKGYHGVTETLDFGVYNYILMDDAFVEYVYKSDEATLGKAHVCYDGFTTVYHYGARPRTSNGTIIRPSTTTYGTYSSYYYSTYLMGYRTAANVLTLTNQATYGVSAAPIVPLPNSTGTRTPNYFNVRIPTFGIRAHDSYMPVASYSDLDFDKTTVNFRSRIYRVPVEYGVYTVVNDRLLDMIQGCTFPAEPI